MNFDTHCRCGWQLPFSVMPMRNTDCPTEDDILADAVVSLICPACQRGHLFASVHEGVKRDDFKEILGKKKEQRH